ncbi:hypothetical protein ACHAXN_009447 [Cyclotella atomus]
MRTAIIFLPTAIAFTTRCPHRATHTALNAIGIFYGTSTGSTEEAAQLIVAEFGEDAAGPFDIDSIQGKVGEEFAKYEALVVGTPTWNTGADTERSGTGWDEIYYSEMQTLNPSLEGKRVAVFGLGDSVSYSENYADATGELHDVFESLGCKMLGYTSTEGYLHDASKSQRGDKFVGLLLDAVNQEELTEDRVKNWVSALKAEGILESGGSGMALEVSMAEPKVKVDMDVVANGEQKALQPAVVSVSQTGFVAHYNSRTDSTMWINVDGKSSFFTNGKP